MISNCETELLCPDPENCDDDCIMLIHPNGGEPTGETVKQGYLRGMEELANEQFERAQATFADVAREGEGEGGSQNPPPPSWNLICKTLTDAAYSLSNSGGERNLKPRQSKNTKPDLDASGIAIYPNPTADFTTIILPKKLCHISVSDVHGKTVFETEASEAIDISTANWQDGVYFITIEPTDKSKRAVRKKLLVQRL